MHSTACSRSPSRCSRKPLVGFDALGSEVRFQGRMIRTGIERYRHDDGTEVSREKVWHPGAVGVVALEQDSVWLTRQPREVVGATASLEVPAGKLDVEGESPLDTAKRELAEEIGQHAERWKEIFVFYTSPGFSDERIWLYEATGLSVDPDFEPDRSERIEIVRWPLDRLDEAIAECEDSKTLIGLLWLAARRRG
ncbi:MAG: NUDIX hydrolase [Solirubrobacterales bacterium]|nr:NUDIX hydrolase [Solirubrobacterales bacterium]MBV9168042.1 NUDIX hydrolase [Solirubrobacterales bacterium]